MTDYGVTSTGFVKKDVDVIKAELEEEFKSIFGDGINVLATSVFGQIIGVIADRESDIWDLGEDIYNSQYPDTASDQSLDNVSSINGVTRLTATQSTVNVLCTGDNGTVLAVDRVLKNGADALWDSTEEKTLATATVWAGSTAYVVGDIRSNDSNIYICTVAGTSAGAGGPTGTGDGITDGTCEWNFVGDGLAYADVPFEAQETGVIPCAAGAIHTDAGTGSIETPVTGWNDARNVEDATVGRARETDTEYRLRRAQLLTAIGKSTLDSMVAAILRDVDNVTQVRGFENVTDTTDAAGLPPHSVEMVVQGGADQDIWDTIWDSKPGGIRTYGDEDGTVVDANGDDQTVEFSRPDDVPIHVIIDVTTNSDYPTDGDDQIKAAIVAWGGDLGIGSDVYASIMLRDALDDISGVVDISKLWISKTDPPTGDTPIVIAPREISTWSTTNIDVTST